MTAPTTIAIAAVVTAASLVGGMQWKARHNVVAAGFYFEDVTFELPDPRRIGGQLSADERQRVMAVARAEVVEAFAGLRVHLSESRNAFYRVRVAQVLTFHRVAVSGQSNVFGPLGGFGSVSFATLASQAIVYAPAEATRAEIIDAIGRGLGRAAVHEFAHQILPHVPIHGTKDAHSYEHWSSNREAQYYGPMRWDVARPFLEKRLGG